MGENSKRYSRQTVIPGVGLEGQKKLLTAKILVLAPSIEASKILLYYLAAVGIGTIEICTYSKSGRETILNNLKDLNSNSRITYRNIGEYYEQIEENTCFDCAIAIVTGLENREEGLINLTQQVNKNTPIFSISYNGWLGGLYFSTINNWNYHFPRAEVCREKNEFTILGEVFSRGFICTIAVTELVKYIINTNSIFKDIFNFNLLHLSFSKEAVGKAISDSREMDIGTWNNYQSYCERLKELRILVVGTGGLGSPVDISLLEAGVGCIGIIDFDVVDESNLNRQILHSESRIGMPKVDSAEAFISTNYENSRINKYNIRIDSGNILEILKNYDLLIDAVDNFKTRYILNDACYIAKKPMIEAGVDRFDGLNMSIVPDKGPCYRCLFPKLPDENIIKSPAQRGILGSIPGTIGFLQGAEAIKLFLGIGNRLEKSIMYYEGNELNFERIDVDKNPKCNLCGATHNI